MQARSAALPGSSEPILAASPSAAAPPSVAMRSACAASTPQTSAAVRASVSTSSAPAAAGLSVPSAPRSTPLATTGTRAPRRRSACGQLTTLAPWRERSSRSASSQTVAPIAVNPARSRPSDLSWRSHPEPGGARALSSTPGAPCGPGPEGSVRAANSSRCSAMRASSSSATRRTRVSSASLIPCETSGAKPVGAAATRRAPRPGRARRCPRR